MNLQTTNQFSLDVPEFVRNLRQHDRDECALLYPGLDIVSLLGHTLDTSLERVLVTFEGKPLSVGGVALNPVGPGFTVWMVGTTEMDSLAAKKASLKFWREQVHTWLYHYCRLSNYCSADEGQLRVMRAIGFEVYETTDKNVRFIQCVW